jgi:hypothetical protein
MIYQFHFAINAGVFFIEWYENKHLMSGGSHEWNVIIHIPQDENKFKKTTEFSVNLIPFLSFLSWLQFARLLKPCVLPEFIKKVVPQYACENTETTDHCSKKKTFNAIIHCLKNGCFHLKPSCYKCKLLWNYKRASILSQLGTIVTWP